MSVILKEQVRLKILVVDDDPRVRKTLTDILRIKGYDPIEATSGAEGIAEVSRTFVNLALIDLKLPDMSGIEVMECIKAVSPLIEVIILTGNASLETAIDATNKGAFSYLLKPYQVEDLLLHIRHAIDKQKIQEEIIRLASYPRLNPSPIIELNPLGEMSYVNPACERLFPEIASSGSDHPILSGWQEMFATLREDTKREIVREIKFYESVYEEHITYVVESDVIRIYVMDITKRKQAEEALQALATTDSLTGIANRRVFNEVLEHEIKCSERHGVPLSLIMYDVDHFKQINDSHGHDVGDDVLKNITEVVRNGVRDIDVFARWGGEEFMILAVQTDIQAAAHLAERLRAAIAKVAFEKVGHVTASFGVTSFHPDDDSAALLKRADAAVYKAKQSGKNRVEVVVYEKSEQFFPETNLSLGGLHFS